MIFDELVNYPEYKQGEMKAIWDVFKKTPHAIDIVAHSCNTIAMPTPKIGQRAILGKSIDRRDMTTKRLMTKTLPSIRRKATLPALAPPS